MREIAHLAVARGLGGAELAFVAVRGLVQVDVRERCAALWAMVTSGDDTAARELLEAAARASAAGA